MAEDARLAELRAGYIQTVTSLSPVWTRSVWKRTSKVPESAGLPMREFDGVLLDWAQDGRKFHYHVHEGGVSDGSVRPPGWWSSDGSSVWEVGYMPRDDQFDVAYVKRRSLQSATDSDIRTKRTPGNWLGLYFNISPQQQTGATLATLLKQAEGVDVVDEEVDGHSCWKVELQYKTALPGEVLPVTAWFDPQVGYLPRRIVPHFSIDSPASDYRVASFRRLTGDDVHAEQWFPEVMRVENDLVVDDLTVQEVLVGDPLEASLFKPAVPRGVQVFDLDNAQQSQAFIGLMTRPARERRMAEYRAEKEARANARTVLPVDLTPQIAAEPGRQLRWTLVLVVTGLLMLVVGTVRVLRAGRAGKRS